MKCLAKLNHLFLVILRCVLSKTLSIDSRVKRIKKFYERCKKPFIGQYIIWECTEDLDPKLFHLGQNLSNPKFNNQTFGTSKMPGIASPWVYIGLDYPNFPAHLEDLLFAGWNLQIFGNCFM